MEIVCAHRVSSIQPSFNGTSFSLAVGCQHCRVSDSIIHKTQLERNVTQIGIACIHHIHTKRIHCQAFVDTIKGSYMHIHCQLNVSYIMVLLCCIICLENPSLDLRHISSCLGFHIQYTTLISEDAYFFIEYRCDRIYLCELLFHIAMAYCASRQLDRIYADYAPLSYCHTENQGLFVCLLRFRRWMVPISMWFKYQQQLTPGCEYKNN